MPGRRARHGEAQAWVRAVAQGQTDECQRWPFLSKTGQTPRPVVGRRGHGVEAVAQAILRSAGRELRDGEQANHTCDDPWCCNPRHLYAGTQSQNIRDAIDRGRMSGLSAETVEEIKKLSRTMSYKLIASRLGVSFYAVRSTAGSNDGR